MKCNSWRGLRMTRLGLRLNRRSAGEGAVRCAGTPLDTCVDVGQASTA